MTGLLGLLGGALKSCQAFPTSSDSSELQERSLTAKDACSRCLHLRRHVIGTDWLRKYSLLGSRRCRLDHSTCDPNFRAARTTAPRMGKVDICRASKRTDQTRGSSARRLSDRVLLRPIPILVRPFSKGHH
ncbi:hypothetical protein F5Y15DRAFT_190086 [Xylariaceae sp. FL0016]|nr:hypothetical protein F5Y15DRAFT_190086 [Xylariaceae sp. FL0016]